MVDDVFGELFLDDEADTSGAEAPIVPPVTVPAAPPVAAEPEQVPQQAPAPAPAVASETATAAPQAPKPEDNRSDRELKLANALNTLMQENHDVEAAALVSLDGFTMASALPEGMQEDRVGAMSAAILGLGERAAAELGRGKLSQVFIEGEHGYVLLMAAGERAVLTCLADHRAKLGLVIFDMRRAAGDIGEVLG